MTSLNPNQKITTIDFSDDIQFQSYMKMYEGVDLVNTAPELLSIINTTRECHIQEKGCAYRSLLQLSSPTEKITGSEETPWVDGVFVDFVSRDTNLGKIHGQVTASLVESHQSISICVMLVYDDKQTEVVTETVYNSYHNNFQFEVDDIDPSIPVEHICVVAIVSKVDANLMLTAQQIEYNATSVQLNSSTPINKIAVLDPENICTNLGDPVAIAYGRGVNSGESLDYEYNYASTIAFPFNGCVFLKEGCTFDGYISLSLTLDCGRGTTQYYNSFSNIFSSHDVGFMWRFNEDWRQPISYSTIPAGTEINLVFSLTYSYYSKTDNEYKSDTMFISGDNITKYNKLKSFQQMPKLMFLWGCLGRESQITMFDGSKKSISEIIAGDAVCSKDGGKLVVKQQFSGFEKDIIRITTESGFEINATEAHPILTTLGEKRAGTLDSKDMLLLEDGSTSAVVARYSMPYNDDVYNLTFVDAGQTGSSFYSDGILVGDNDMQNNISMRSSALETQISKTLRDEMVRIDDILNKKLYDSRQ